MGESVFSIPLQLHASCISIGGKGVLVVGASGSGKSDMCLQLIDAGAVLVADDRVILERSAQGEVTARAPARLQGMMEVRGLGVITMPWEPVVPLALVVEAAEEPERLPPEETREFFGVQVPCVRLNLLHHSACAKIRLALATQIAGRWQAEIRCMSEE